MRTLVTELKKRKYARMSKPRNVERGSAHDSKSADSDGDGHEQPAVADRDTDGGQRAATSQHGADVETRGGCVDALEVPRRRGRYIPAAVRRAVWKRDGERCTYIDATGQRCRETSGLEFEHRDPHALGGPPTITNLTLHCRSHNGLAAEQVFGRDLMERKKGTRMGTAAP